MRVWVFMLALFLCSCAQYKFIYNTIEPSGHTVQIAPIYIEDTWDDIDRAQLHDAIDQWNVALNGTIILRIEDDHYNYTKAAPQNKLILLKISEQAANRQEEYIALAWTYGSYSGVGGNRIYFVRARMEWYDLRYVALHEIAHALGADHQKYRGLMSPTYNRTNYHCIDKPTLLQVAAYRHIPIDSLLQLSICTS